MKGVKSDNDRCTISLFPLSSLLKYTRLTVTVENVVQAGVLNSGNPVLKTFVSGLDTREKYHFTNGASSANEHRGPYDVANLSSLLGLSMERGKAATSKNCSAFIARAIRKKHSFKEAIRVEKIPSGQQVDTKEPWFADCNNWDEISSGEGDIQLDDIAKFFTASSKVPKTSKAIDFTSITKELPSHGMRLNDWLPAGGNKSSPQEDTPSISDAKSDESPDMDKISKQPDGPEVVLFSYPKSLFSTPVGHQTSSTLFFPTDGTQSESTSIFCEEPMSKDKDCISISDVDLMLPDNVVSGLTSERESGTSFSCQANPIEPGSIGSVLTPKDHVHTTVIDDLAFPMETAPRLSTPKESDSFPQIGNSEIPNNSDDALGAHAVNMEKIVSETVEWKQIELVSAGCDMPIVIGELEEKQNSCDAKVLPADDKPVEYHTNTQVDAALFADEVSHKDSFVEMEEHAQEVLIEMSSTAHNESISGM
ncbi:hypothetical protein MKX01_002136 [Papaver californicum]|nr:hypothetical protein MKX01_002136 [Papaver californicum]